MKRALFPALLVTGAGLVLLVGAAPAAAATGVASGTSTIVAERAAAVECQVPDPTWEVAWTSDEAVTLRQCGGTAGSADATGDELPLTGAGGRAAAGVAATLLGAGAGLVLAARRRRVRFAA